MPVSKNQIKLVSSLAMKKFRDETGLFVAEGTKLISALAEKFACETIFATRQWLELNEPPACVNLIEASSDELIKLSQQKTPQGILAVFRKPQYSFDRNIAKNKLVLALDGIQDPGNLGTIIRLADWFGIHDIICSPETADVYAPKVVQATMGALASVNVFYMHLSVFFNSIPESTPVYGTFMEGRNIYTEKLSKEGIIVLGNEGNGISPDVEKYVTEKLMIPDFAGGNKTSESLNVAIAGAIVCSEFRRRRF
jgi:TrmH family RNA methyltransferase